MPAETNLTQVLLVEDSAGEALLTAQVLGESAAPVKLVVARDGVQALTMLDDPAFHPVLIILDLNIALISGHGVMERNPRKDIPVIILARQGTSIIGRRALGLGAREYIQKPMDLEAYKIAVLHIIQKWPHSKEDARDQADRP